MVISTTTKAREFPFEDEADARAAANELWRWAKDSDEHGTVTIYERGKDRGWLMVQHEKV